MTLIPDLRRDLVEAAARQTGRRRLFAVGLRLTPAVVVAAALIGVAVLPFGGDRSDRAPSSGEPARGQPPRRGPQAVPGSLSRPVGFDFAGARYSIVGFQGRSASRNRVVCTRLMQRVGDRGRRLVGAMCAGERLLTRALDDEPARTVGFGGGRPTQISGFARADVAAITVLDSQYPSRAVLSEPWSPEPWPHEPIRFFLVLTNAPPEHPRLQARLTNGELVDMAP